MADEARLLAAGAPRSRVMTMRRLRQLSGSRGQGDQVRRPRRGMFRGAPPAGYGAPVRERAAGVRSSICSSIRMW